MGTLLDSLTSVAGPAVGQIAERLGESEPAVTRGMETSFASVLGGLITRTKDPNSIRQLFDLLNSRTATAGVGDDVQSMVGSLAAGVSKTGGAGSFLTMLFNGKSNAVGNLVAQTAGFKNPSSGSSVLGMAAPLVLGFLGKKVREDGLNFGGLTSLLEGERDSIFSAAPPGLVNFVEAGTARPHVATGEVVRIPAKNGRRHFQVPVESSRNRWMWPALGLAVIALAFFVMSRARAPGTESSAVSTGAAVESAAGEVAESVGGLGAFVKHTLPGGVELNIPSRGIESKLIAFIEDASRPVSDTTWFDFDRLNFASGSATILPESREQLNNITAVLKAYPNANVTVGGYTDAVGDASANLRLSQRRADAVRQALIGNGIPASRIQAEGYGELHPVASNATEEGRARNRRIALRVAKK